jgi:hypothetical protein
MRILWGKVADLLITKSFRALCRMTTSDGVPGGTERVIGGLAYTNTAASSAVSNTITETLFDKSYDIPPNTLKAGSRITVAFQGIATATNGTDTLAIKLYIGGLTGTALLTLAARDVANNDIFAGEAEVIVRTAGSSGTFVAWGKSPTNPNAAGSALNMNFVGSTAIDTTAKQTVGVSATWSVANAGNSCRLDVLSVVIH